MESTEISTRVIMIMMSAIVFAVVVFMFVGSDNDGQELSAPGIDRDERVGEEGSSGESLTIGDPTFSPPRQVPPQDTVSGQYSAPLASESTYSLSTGASSDSSHGPDVSDTGELGLPPEASDPGTVGPAPETTGAGVLERAPEAGELAIEFGAPHSSTQDMSSLPPEAPDPGTIGPEPEASDLGN